MPEIEVVAIGEWDASGQFHWWNTKGEAVQYGKPSGWNEMTESEYRRVIVLARPTRKAKWTLASVLCNPGEASWDSYEIIGPPLEENDQPKEVRVKIPRSEKTLNLQLECTFGDWQLMETITAVSEQKRKGNVPPGTCVYYKDQGSLSGAGSAKSQVDSTITLLEAKATKVTPTSAPRWVVFDTSGRPMHGGYGHDANNGTLFANFGYPAGIGIKMPPIKPPGKVLYFECESKKFTINNIPLYPNGKGVTVER